jgi:cytochrome c553
VRRYGYFLYCHHERASAREGSAFSKIAKKSEKRIPRRLKSARDDKHLRTYGAAKAAPLQDADHNQLLAATGHEFAALWNVRNKTCRWAR